MTRLPLLAVIVLALAGCSATRQEKTVRVEKRQGLEAGKPTNLVITMQEEAQADTKAGMDPAAVTALVHDAVKAAVPGAEAIAALIPKPKDPEPLKLFGLDPETAMGLAGAAWGGERVVAAALKRRRLKTERKP